MKDLPKTVDFLCPECREHFEKVRRYLELNGIKYVLDSTLVRGLDYYTRTVFEIVYRGLGAQDAMCGGGRYDGLIETLGGPPTPGVGVGIGLERLILTLEKQKVFQPQIKPLDVFIVACGEKEREHAVDLAFRLRLYGLSVDFDILGRGMKAQLKAADRSGAIVAVIIGEEELQNEEVVVKIMQSGTQQNVPLLDIETALTSIIMCQQTARRSGN
jgi:histidyl-tRNA synthetase